MLNELETRVMRGKNEKINALMASNKDLHEQVAFLESREVCTMPHEDIEMYGCPYCHIEKIMDQLRRITGEQFGEFFTSDGKDLLAK